MIVSFGDAATADLYHGRRTARARRFPADLVPSMRRKLDLIEGAHDLEDLGKLPGNRLELLRGDLAGFRSLRVNSQWRVVFRWTAAGAASVRIADYH